MPIKYLEDFRAGDTIDLGQTVVDKDELIAFGKRFDPQPFHVDEEAAKLSPFKGLITSGWHTTAILMRLIVDTVTRNTVSLGSPGMDEIRWLVPVRPGDTLHAEAKILEVVPSRSKPDRGHMRVLYEVSNQKGEKVMTVIGRGIFGRRPAAG